jgi:hypothetical protein
MLQCSMRILQAIVLSGIIFLFTVSFSDSKQMMQDIDVAQFSHGLRPNPGVARTDGFASMIAYI